MLKIKFFNRKLKLIVFACCFELIVVSLVLVNIYFTISTNFDCDHDGNGRLEFDELITVTRHMSPDTLENFAGKEMAFETSMQMQENPK
jgi:hypothetical protein